MNSFIWLEETCDSARDWDVDERTIFCRRLNSTFCERDWLIAVVENADEALSNSWVRYLTFTSRRIWSMNWHNFANSYKSIALYDFDVNDFCNS
jgi:hypothetical protein